jgi:hypothetical protein
MNDQFYLGAMQNALAMWAAATTAADKAYWWRIYIQYVQAAVRAGTFGTLTTGAATDAAVEAAVVSVAEKIVAEEGTAVVVKRLGTRMFIKRLIQTWGGTGPLKHPVIMLIAGGVAVLATTHDVYAATQDMDSKGRRYEAYMQRYLKYLAQAISKHPNTFNAAPPDSFEDWLNAGEP